MIFLGDSIGSSFLARGLAGIAGIKMILGSVAVHDFPGAGFFESFGCATV